MFFTTKKAILASILLLLAVAAAIGLYFWEIPTTKNTTSSTSSKETVITEESKPTKPTVEEQLKTIISDMTLDQKIGQLFLARVPETNQIEDIKTYHLGGYLLFGRDVQNETTESLTKKIASYQEATDFPLLIGMDEEGGTVSRLSQNENILKEPFKSPQAIYQADGLEGIKTDIDQKATLFKQLGIHIGLFPVADISTDTNSFIYNRTIGLDVEGTSQYVVEVVKELNKNHIGSTLKHFPGSGETQDTHTEIVRDTRSLEELKKNSIPPFQAGIEAGADSVLVSHNIVEAIDKHVPASISPKIHEILRDELKFNGVTMTDDMDMNGLSDFISQEQAALAALKAGNDMILSSSYQKQIPVIKSAVQSGDYPEAQLDESVLRILTWKHKLGLISLN